MKKLLLAVVMTVVATPVLAQTAVGTGVGISDSNSQSGAVAIAGTGGRANAQGGRASANGNGASSSALTVNSAAIPAATTSNVVTSGTSTLRTVPTVAPPGLAAAGLETCLGSASGGVSAVGFGVSGGSSFVDEGCQARLDSRTLASYGLKQAAVARLCQRIDIWRSMPDTCARNWPPGVPYPNGVVIVGNPGLVMSAGSGETTIRVVDGRDGVEKDCSNYSYTHHKCYQWVGESRHQQVASLHTHKKLAVASATTKKPAPAPTVAASPKAVEKPAAEPKKEN